MSPAHVRNIVYGESTHPNRGVELKHKFHDIDSNSRISKDETIEAVLMFLCFNSLKHLWCYHPSWPICSSALLIL